MAYRFVDCGKNYNYCPCTMMMNIKKGNVFFVTFILLLFGLKGAAASSFQNYSKIPFFVHLFLFINIFLLALNMLMILEVKKVSASSVWDNIFMGNIFTTIDAITLEIILCKYINSLGLLTSILIASLYTHAVFMVDVGEYYLIKPLLKEKLKLIQMKSILLFAFIITVIWVPFIKIVPSLDFPSFQKTYLIFLFISLFILVNFFIFYDFLFISKSYSTVGFVSKPFFWSGTGAVSLFIGSVLLFYRLDLNSSYYYILAYFIPVILALSYYLRFVVEYPSIIQPKWKALMPVDLPKVAATLALAFLTVSFYFTARESPNFIVFQNIPYVFVIAFLLPVFLAVLLIFTYLKTISARTKLRYWRYLKNGQFIHLAVTFYVFSLIFLSWNNATTSTKMIFALFALVAFAFYQSFAMDLYTILNDQNIKPIFNVLDFLIYILFFCASFLLTIFGIALSYGVTSGFIGIELSSYPLILLFIAFFLIAFGSYLSVTHKGFEEIMRKNIWSELSYIFAFIAFTLVYFIYTSLNTNLQQFPFHDLAFIGYFAVLIIEIISTRTLGGQSKYQKTIEGSLDQLLNRYAGKFFRTDYLEALWEKTMDRYVAEDDIKKLGFDSSRRQFNLVKTDEKTRLEVAVRMLLGMYRIPNVEKMTISEKSLEDLKKEIEDIVNEKILMLPEDVRCEFDESRYYPTLYENTINNLFRRLKTFIPLSEQKKIFERLKRREEQLMNISFEVSTIRVKEGTEFSRDAFLKLLKLYLEVIEEKFPFKRFLMDALVREEIKERLEIYNITVGDVLDRVPTGVEDMDKLMAGGLAKGSSTLLIAEETKTKQKILLSFIKQGLLEGNIAIYATSKRPFQQILGELQMDVEELTNFLILDLYENLYAEDRVSEIVEEGQRIIVPLSKILFQRSIVKAIKSPPKDIPKIVIIDAYDDFSRYYSPNEILELMQKHMEGLKRWNCTSVIVLDPYSYLIKKEGIDDVKKNFDNVMILSGEDKDAQMFVEKLYHGTPSKPIIHLPW